MAEEPTLIIEAGRTERHYWKDLWRYRELIANKAKAVNRTYLERDQLKVIMMGRG